MHGDASAAPAGLRAPGDHHVDVPVMCSITRFGMRHAAQLPFAWRDYRRVVREAERSGVPGLLHSVFLVEDPRTCYSLSLWSGEPRMSAYVEEHIRAARRMFPRLALHGDDGPELWSTTWTLRSVTNNLNWGDLDLRGVIERH
jgi:hypothetical protein